MHELLPLASFLQDEKRDEKAPKEQRRSCIKQRTKLFLQLRSMGQLHDEETESLKKALTQVMILFPIGFWRAL
jgi:hypothetical protein